MYVLSVVHPPIGLAAYGRAVVSSPALHRGWAVRAPGRLIMQDFGCSQSDADALTNAMRTLPDGTPCTDVATGLTFRIDLADSAPHPCPCCDRLVLPTNHAYAADEDTYCDGCFTWSHNIPACLPANTAHTEEPR